MHARRLAATATLAGLLALGSGVAQADQDVAVEMADFKFVPANVTVKAGETVRFQLSNTGAFPHDLRIEGQGFAGEAVPNGNVAAGQKTTWEVTFQQAGTYQMWCPVGNHRARGMEGALAVTQVSAPASAAPASGAAATLPRTGGLPVLAQLGGAAAGLLLAGAGWLARRRS